MFGLSTWEILIILALALIFVGPDQLPKVARQIGKGVRQVRGAMGKVDDEMRRAMREAAAEVDDAGKAVGTLIDAAGPHEPPPDAADADANAAPGAAPLDPLRQAHLGRDWSQVGKNPVAGRVATATTARPPEPPPPPANAEPPAPGVAADASAASDGAPTSAPAAPDPAAPPTGGPAT